MSERATIATPSPITRRTLILLLLIVALAAVLRLTDLAHVPAGGDGDSAWISLDALDWLDRGVWPTYINAMYAPEPLMVYLIGLFIPVTGISMVTARLVTALAGIATVALSFPAAYWLIGENASPRFREGAALLAALSAAVSLHAVQLSRMGIRAPLLPPAILLVVWLTAWAWRRGGWGRWVLAGTALALTQYIYISGRMMAPLLILWTLHSLWADRDRFRQQWRGWLVMALTAGLLVLPNLILFIVTPEAFSGRADIASGATGGLFWRFDLSATGGPLGLLLGKLGSTLLALGIRWDGPYKTLPLPALAPLFFGGLLVGVIAALRHPRRLRYGWPLLALPVLYAPDLISGTLTAPHPLRQIGMLPFLFILSGLGIMLVLEWLLKRWPGITARRILVTVLVVLAVSPSLLTFRFFMAEHIPQVYADPATAWHLEQADVDISRRMVAQPDAAYLLPYNEYTRWTIAWLTAAPFRDRHSAISADGLLTIPTPPGTITVVQAADPHRARHDGQPTTVDPRLWVLLHDGQTLLLPPLTDTQNTAVQTLIDETEPEPLIDGSGTTIARFYSAPAPKGLFAPRDAVTYPLDASFALPGEDAPQVRLVGYSLPSPDLTPGTTVPVTLYWEPLTRITENAEIFVQVWDDAGNNLAGWHGLPWNGTYRARIWQPGEIVPTHHLLTLPDDLPVGRYSLVAGLFRLLHNDPLAASGPNAAEDGTAARAADLRVPPPPPQEAGTPPPQPATFGGLIDVAGLDISRAEDALPTGEPWTLQPGDTLTVRITWAALDRPPLDYSAFLHLSAAPDQPPLAQADLTLGGDFPSGAWRTGDTVQDTVTLTLPADLPPGTYDLLLGVYYWQSGERLPLPDGQDRLPLGQIEISSG